MLKLCHHSLFVHTGRLRERLFRKVVRFFIKGTQLLKTRKNFTYHPILTSSPHYFSVLQLNHACLMKNWLATFRNVIAAANEAEIYNRIRALEGLQYYNLPPQNNPGEYESIVRDHFDQAVSVNHYREIYDQEYFELLVLEPKGVLQDKLKNLMLEEPNLGRILEFSPYNNIKSKAPLL